MQKESTHPEHPIRNFFYLLWSLVNALSYVGFFYALATPTLPYRGILLPMLGAALCIALIFGVFCPLFGKKKK